MAQVHAIRTAHGTDRPPTFSHAVEAFLAAHTVPGAWSRGTATKYRQTLDLLARQLAGQPDRTGAGPDVVRELTVLDTPAGAAALLAAYSIVCADRAPATRARHLSTLRSALSWWRQAGWLRTDPTATWAAPKVSADGTRALTRAQVETVLRLPAAGLRERTLWRLLYETAARADEILTLDVADLDLASKRARAVSKGGAVEWVYWQTGAALLLPRLLAGRDRGPVFLADRLPTRPVPAGDLCPVTGRARLSYRRAAELFADATRQLADPVEKVQGWTLHQLRHSALTHAAEDGTNTPMLLARSRHTSVRSLERYARPGPEAIAAHLAATDPAARRR